MFAIQGYPCKYNMYEGLLLYTVQFVLTLFVTSYKEKRRLTPNMMSQNVESYYKLKHEPFFNKIMSNGS